MKTVITALNSKYIHSSLAPWYLKYACGDSCGEVLVKNYTINDNMEWVLSKLYMEKPDVIAFSCYIWNIGQVLKLSANLKKVLPNSVIIFGGPEVSFQPKDIMRDNPFIDYIICGEGEVSFRHLLEIIQKQKRLELSNQKKLDNTERVYSADNMDVYKIENIEGLCYRRGEEVKYDGKYCIVEALDSLPSPFTDEMLNTSANKIVYFETSRGCPFSCSYCLSSTFNGVRYFPLERVKKDLSNIIKSKARQVKFVDRTFNCNKRRAEKIIKFLIDNATRKTDKNFHLEAAGDLFDEEMLELLTKAKDGLIQFEIGVQSINGKTLEAVGRRTELEKVFKTVNNLISFGNIHIHLDLIAGLPYEDYDSIQKSFNAVYELKPHKLQLGFLKMLKGSRIRSQAKKHNYCFRDYPPYEVLYNEYINFDEMTEIKGIEEIFEKYYNSGRFINSLNYIIKRHFSDAFQFYKSFYQFNIKMGYFDRSLPLGDLYTLFLNFAQTIILKKTYTDSEKSEQEITIISDLLKFDFFSTNSSRNLPDGIKKIQEPEYKKKRLDFLNKEENRRRYFPDFQGSSPKHLLRYANFVIFDWDITRLLQGFESKENMRSFKKERTVILFNYSLRNKVSGVYRYHKINF